MEWLPASLNRKSGCLAHPRTTSLGDDYKRTDAGISYTKSTTLLILMSGESFWESFPESSSLEPEDFVKLLQQTLRKDIGRETVRRMPLRLISSADQFLFRQSRTWSSDESSQTLFVLLSFSQKRFRGDDGLIMGS